MRFLAFLISTIFIIALMTATRKEPPPTPQVGEESYPVLRAGEETRAAPQAEEKPPPTPQADSDGESQAVTVSNDGRWLATGEYSNVHLWDGKQGLLRGKWANSAGEKPAIFSPAGTLLLLSQKEETTGRISLILRAVPSGKLLHTFALPQALFFDGRTVRGVQDGDLVVFDARTGKRLRRIELPDAPGDDDSEHFAMSANGRFLAGAEYAGGQHTARLWDAQTGKLLRIITGERNVLNWVAASPDGKWLLTEGENPQWQPPAGAATESAYSRQLTLKLWNVRTGKIAHIWPGRNANDWGGGWLQFSRDGASVLCNGSGFIRTWDIATGKETPGRVGRAKSRIVFEGTAAFSANEQWLGGFLDEFKVDSQFNLTTSSLVLVNTATSKVVRRFHMSTS